MEERIEYQVLAPDSVAWYIQAALVADRKGNESTRDLALAEAQRIAAERRLVEGPAPDGSRVLCYDVAHEYNGVRLAKMETAQRIEHRTMHATFNEHQARLEELEREMATGIIYALMKRVEVLEAADAPVGHRHDGGFWIACPFCVDDETGMCSACNGTRKIWEMPEE